MRKNMLLLGCILCCLMSACRAKPAVSENAITEITVFQSGEERLIDSGNFYRIYKESAFKMHFHIYNSLGEIVLSESTDRPLNINMVNDNLVNIRISMGTGIAMNRYYSVDKNVFSQEYTYVVANRDEVVAYIDVPDQKPFENRKIVVRNVFNSDALYKEFSLDFSPVDTPVEEAVFSEDGKSLLLTYLSGEDETQVTETLMLQDG